MGSSRRFSPTVVGRLPVGRPERSCCRICDRHISFGALCATAAGLGLVCCAEDRAFAGFHRLSWNRRAFQDRDDRPWRLLADGHCHLYGRGQCGPEFDPDGPELRHASAAYRVQDPASWSAAGLARRPARRAIHRNRSSYRGRNDRRTIRNRRLYPESRKFDAHRSDVCRPHHPLGSSDCPRPFCSTGPNALCFIGGERQVRARFSRIPGTRFLRRWVLP